MLEGRVAAVMRIINEASSGGILDLEKQVVEGKTVRDILREKHPEGKEATQEALLGASEGPEPPHPVLSHILREHQSNNRHCVPLVPLVRQEWTRLGGAGCVRHFMVLPNICVRQLPTLHAESHQSMLTQKDLLRSQLVVFVHLISAMV